MKMAEVVGRTSENSAQNFGKLCAELAKHLRRVLKSDPPHWEKSRGYLYVGMCKPAHIYV